MSFIPWIFTNKSLFTKFHQAKSHSELPVQILGTRLGHGKLPWPHIISGLGWQSDQFMARQRCQIAFLSRVQLVGEEDQVQLFPEIHGFHGWLKIWENLGKIMGKIWEHHGKNNWNEFVLSHPLFHFKMHGKSMPVKTVQIFLENIIHWANHLTVDFHVRNQWSSGVFALFWGAKLSQEHQRYWLVNLGHCHGKVEWWCQKQ